MRADRLDLEYSSTRDSPVQRALPRSAGAFLHRLDNLLRAKHCALHLLPVLLAPSCSLPLALSTASPRPDSRPFAPSPTPFGLSDTADQLTASRDAGSDARLGLFFPLTSRASAARGRL